MKKVFSLFLVALFVLCLATSCGSSIEKDWNKLEFGEHYPTPQKGKLRIGSNLDDMFMGAIENVKEDYYYEYKQMCIDAGYIIESDSYGTQYEAYNAEGYKVSLSYISKDINLSLYKPEELSDILWPSNGIAKALPKPASTIGKINADRSDYFSVIVGEMTLEQFNDYVKACADKGFAKDYSKGETYYNAKRKQGTEKVYLSYEGFNRVKITIEEVNSDDYIDEEETTSTTEKSTTTTATKSKSDDDMDPDFKKAMDAYEKFMGEYVDFMKKYMDNPTDLSLLADYADFMSDYNEYCDDFAAWENEDLNDAELDYYLEVQSRVNKKLLEVSQ